MGDVLAFLWMLGCRHPVLHFVHDPALTPPAAFIGHRIHVRDCAGPECLAPNVLVHELWHSCQRPTDDPSWREEDARRVELIWMKQ